MFRIGSTNCTQVGVKPTFCILWPIFLGPCGSEYCSLSISGQLLLSPDPCGTFQGALRLLLENIQTYPKILVGSWGYNEIWDIQRYWPAQEPHTDNIHTQPSSTGVLTTARAKTQTGKFIDSVASKNRPIFEPSHLIYLFNPGNPPRIPNINTPHATHTRSTTALL